MTTTYSKYIYLYWVDLYCMSVLENHLVVLLTYTVCTFKHVLHLQPKIKILKPKLQGQGQCTLAVAWFSISCQVGSMVFLSARRPCSATYTISLAAVCMDTALSYLRAAFWVSCWAWGGDKEQQLTNIATSHWICVGPVSITAAILRGHLNSHEETFILKEIFLFMPSDLFSAIKN